MEKCSDFLRTVIYAINLRTNRIKLKYKKYSQTVGINDLTNIIYV